MQEAESTAESNFLTLLFISYYLLFKKEDSMKNRKRLLLIALMTAATVSALAQQYDPESDFTVAKQTDGKSVEITKYIGSKTDSKYAADDTGDAYITVSFTIRNNLTRIFSVRKADNEEGRAYDEHVRRYIGER